MRIAQVSPLIESVPPKGYGGTERVVAYLTEELVAARHQVTLFASGDSETSAELVACSPCAVRASKGAYDPIWQYACQLDEVWRRRDQFDIIHFHIDVLHFPLFRALSQRTLTTLHGRQDLPALKPIYRHFPEFPLVSISDAQRLPVPEGNFVATVHHGLPLDLHQPTLSPRGGYLAFLGRVSAEKGIEAAIEIARRVGVPLKVAAKIDRNDEAYFRERVAPLFKLPGIDYVGEIGEREKSRFLGDARALLFPIDWPEPFGLVMLEAMACGTPVLAFRRGAVPEVLDEERSGIIVDDVDEAVMAMPTLLSLNRGAVRRTFEARFSSTRMAEDYVALYERAAGAPRARVVGEGMPLPLPTLAPQAPGLPADIRQATYSKS